MKSKKGNLIESKKQISQIKKAQIMSIIGDSWSQYRKMNFEDFRNSVKKELKKRSGNVNEQISHEEFNESVLEYMKNLKNKEKDGR